MKKLALLCCIQKMYYFVLINFEMFLDQRCLNQEISCSIVQEWGVDLFALSGQTPWSAPHRGHREWGWGAGDLGPTSGEVTCVPLGGPCRSRSVSCAEHHRGQTGIQTGSSLGIKCYCTDIGELWHELAVKMHELASAF